MAYLGDPIRYIDETPLDTSVRKKWASSLQESIYRGMQSDKRQYFNLVDKRQRAVAKINGMLGKIEEGEAVSIGDITSSMEDTDRAADFAMELITQLGHDRGQLNMWLALGVGDLVPDGYSHNEGDRISYEMLTAQRDNWSLAVDRTLRNLVDQGHTLLLKIIGTLDLLILYVAQNPSEESRSVVLGFRDKLEPITAAAEVIAEVASSQLSEVLAAYRERLRRFNFDLDSLNIPPFNPTQPLNWMVIALVALVGYTVLK